MADVTIREWMSDAIKNDAYSLLGYQKDFNGKRKPSYDEFMSTLDNYGMFWEKLCRSNYQVKDTLSIDLNCDISTRLIVDTPGYVTYQYSAYIYEREDFMECLDRTILLMTRRDRQYLQLQTLSSRQSWYSSGRR